jgi:hypothetical protein
LAALFPVPDAIALAASRAVSASLTASSANYSVGGQNDNLLRVRPATLPQIIKSFLKATGNIRVLSTIIQGGKAGGNSGIEVRLSTVGQVQHNEAGVVENYDAYAGGRRLFLPNASKR